MDELIYGKEYRCYWGDEYPGMAICAGDHYMGDCFLRLVPDQVRYSNGEV